ncbi:YihY/virulence factor BrkB family protein [Alicyclobacillus fastidiosus]|uniref:YihY/virulence factor BrkB family protein n=1 Tax=Alicyclobacillus fastidiosus TaxID=392011 RepID=A0ABV5AEN3_9BACL|nr:YihY/virulence factor BrkB family protein [Alicyclobacillus fastidiosus]WEH08652.1 YihY/virulence factor BrkB family protein [Alicyclobacillus fastidiosus]
MEERMHLVGRFFTLLAARIFKHDIASLSAQICFYAVFSMFPLLILIIYGTSLVVPQYNFEDSLVNALKPYYPDVGAANQFIKLSIQTLGSVGPRISIVSFVTLTWSATSSFIAVQQALDTIFELEEQRSFLARRIVGFTMVILLIFLAVISSIALALYPHIAEHVSWWGEVARWAPGIHGLTRVIYPLSLFVTCFVFYRYLPSRRVDVNSVLIGAMTATVALDLARALFVVYASHLVSYHLIYGTLTVVILLVLWMYIAGIILLFGAEIAASLDYVGRSKEL